MNQGNLYATLNYEGCKIHSFEDYPSNFGSWRVHFQLEKISCMVTCNRADNLITLSTKSIHYGNETLNLKSDKLVTEQLEIARIAEWIRALRIVIKLNSDKTDINKKELA